MALGWSSFQGSISKAAASLAKVSKRQMESSGDECLTETIRSVHSLQRSVDSLNESSTFHGRRFQKKLRDAVSALHGDLMRMKANRSQGVALGFDIGPLDATKKMLIQVGAFKTKCDENYTNVASWPGLIQEAQHLSNIASNLIDADCVSLLEATQSEFTFVDASLIRDYKGTTLPHHQKLEGVLGKGCFKNFIFDFAGAKRGSHEFAKFLIISHRWEDPKNPDPTGKQLRALIEHLQTHDGIEWIWMDWWCLPQFPRNSEQNKIFRRTLDRIFMVFLSCPVLILFDCQYFGRFWPVYEFFLSTHRITNNGLMGSSSECRFTMISLGAASKSRDDNPGVLLSMWGPAVTVPEACNNMKETDILVTNQRDKDTQIGVLERVNQTCIFMSSLEDTLLGRRLPLEPELPVEPPKVMEVHAARATSRSTTAAGLTERSSAGPTNRSTTRTASRTNWSATQPASGSTSGSTSGSSAGASRSVSGDFCPPTEPDVEPLCYVGQQGPIGLPSACGARLPLEPQLPVEPELPRERMCFEEINGNGKGNQ